MLKFESSAIEDRLTDPFIVAGLALSILLHIALFFSFKFGYSLPESPKSITVSIVPPESIEKRLERTERPQIVLEPKEAKELSEPQTPPKLLSEKDNIVKREQVRRGDEVRARAATQPVQPQPPRQPQSQQPKTEQAPRQQQSSSTKKLQQLTLDDATLKSQFSSAAASMPKASSKVRDLSTYQAFSRPAGSGAQFLGLTGTRDHLPNLPDGDITLLNTKADQFAVFVRRVASRVFSQLRASGWESLSARDIYQLRDYTTIRAVLSLEGKLLSVTLEGPSGSTRFDSVVQEAARLGVRDPNPPKEAVAADGNIRFIFKAKSWVEGAVDGRSGAPFERRWLLLGTGLE